MSNKKKILIVDDEKMNIMVLAHVLKAHYDIIVAADGASGLAAAEKHWPDLILLDIIMPDMDGYEVIGKLKASETTKEIPVVFISGLHDADDREKGMSLGAMDFIMKPFDASVIKSTIDSYF